MEMINLSNSPGTLRGNLTRDAELKYVGQGDGSALLKFSVAVEKSWKTDKTESGWDSETSFFDVIAWRKLAENNAALMQKGVPVVVLGNFVQQSWKNDEGENRSRVVFEATCIAYDGMGISAITRKQRGEGSNSGGSSKQSAANDPYDTDEEPF